MTVIKPVIDNEVGVHVRSAALFVQTAQSFQSEVRVCHSEREANAKSLLALLGLGLSRGSEILVEACGNDAGQALEALMELVENNFGKGKR